MFEIYLYRVRNQFVKSNSSKKESLLIVKQYGTIVYVCVCELLKFYNCSWQYRQY